MASDKDQNNDESTQSTTNKGVLWSTDPSKKPEYFIRRYLNEPDYKKWFEKKYSDYKIYDAIGISESEYGILEKKLSSKIDPGVENGESKVQPEPEKPPEIEKTIQVDKVVESLLETVSEPDSSSSGGQRYTFEEFIDERVLISRDVLGRKEMKIKILEVSDEHPPLQWKFGDRVKVNKILVTIKHLDSQEVEEGEFDIEFIERELTEKRHYTSTNRWVPSNDIKNGYVINSRHTPLISDAIALDYIVF